MKRNANEVRRPPAEGDPMPEQLPEQPTLRAAVPRDGSDNWWGVPGRDQPAQSGHTGPSDGAETAGERR